MPVFRLTGSLSFPPPNLAEPEGLLAVGGDLSRRRLLLAYSIGVFPWYEAGGPLLWWSPPERMVLFPKEFHCSRRLRREIRRGRFRVTADTAFEEVIAGCAELRGPDREATWITDEMRAAYTDLHRAGYAHAIEVWEDDALAGGLYGVSLGGCFFGESMFSRRTDASKVALAHLTAACIAWDFPLIDCQLSTPHLASLGAREIPRDAFLRLLRKGVRRPTRRGAWTEDFARVTVAKGG